MNASTALARVLVDELVRGGVREAVLSPGSRSAPLAFALHEADAAGRLRLHVRIDERTAGFLALGLAKVSDLPVPVVTTSGTAAVNLHPAVIEASHSNVPLVALTADRPPRLRGSGANQTIDQLKLYGDAVRMFHDVGVPELLESSNAYWRALTCRALASCRGDLSHDPGPVHLNLAFDEPLVPPSGDETGLLSATASASVGQSAAIGAPSFDGRLNGAPWTELPRAPHLEVDPYVGAPRTLVLVGDCPHGLGLAAARLAERRGWPLLAEPVTAVRGRALAGGTLLLSLPELPDALQPDRVLVVGRTTLSRAVGRLLRDARVTVDVVAGSPRWSDPSGNATTAASAALLVSDGAAGPSGDAGFLAAWRRCSADAEAAVAAFLDTEAWPTGIHVARALARRLSANHGESLLVLGSSSPVRDLDLASSALPERGLRVVANRGAAGIDGTISTAIGAAIACQRDFPGGHAYALVGDLTFLHDATGLVIGPTEPRPNLTIVVANDDGGAIFSHLEQGAPEYADTFERVFGTPHGTDLAALCAATHTPHCRPSSSKELMEALHPRPGVSVVEVPLDRRVVRDLQQRLHAAVRDRLAVTTVRSEGANT